MTDHEKFKALLKYVGLSYKQLAAHLGLTHDSAKSLLAPGKNLPRWAKSMLLISELINQKDK